MDEQIKIEMLHKTLSKLYPLESYSVVLEAAEGSSFVPRFCWRFCRPDVAGFKLFTEALSSYKGTVRWFLGGGPGGTVCIMASDESSNLQAKDSRGISVPAGGNASQVRKFIEKALIDLSSLCSHLEETMQLGNVEPKPFEYDFRNPPPENQVIDFLDPDKCETVWVVADPQVFATVRHQESSTAKLLHFGLSLKDYEAIFSLIQTSATRQPTYPLLSRFRAELPPVYNSVEIGGLREECLRARKSTTAKDAIYGLDKLLLMCNWAKQFGGGLYFQEP